MKTNFTALDFIVLAAYLIGTTLLGVWLGRNQKDSKDYFVAGHAIPWWAVLFSVVATETSALTFISIPGLAYTTNLGFLQIAAGYLLGRIVVAYTLLPRYYQGDLVTAYALLEKRFGVGTRRFASIVFLVTRAFADSVRVFATAIPIALILGPTVPQQYVMPVAILVLGALTLIYTYHGGMRAVVWTDVLQTSVYLLGGFSAVYLLGKGVTGGWSAILSQAHDAGKLKVVDVYFGFDKPYTLFAGLIGGAFLSMASHGADQVIVQRLLAASSLKESRKALIGSGIAVFFQFSLFLMIGIGLYAFYQARTFAVPDSIFPTFVVDSMPAGLRGLIVAAVLAATMSAHSGAMNSLAASTTHDIYLPLPGRRSAHAQDGEDVHAVLGRHSSHRRTPLQAAGHAGCRDRALDRVIYLRRVARRLLPRHVVATCDPARCDPRHGSRDYRDELRSIREADHVGVSIFDRRADSNLPHRVSVVRSDRNHLHRGSRYSLVIHPPCSN
jgi:SSS family transporter